MEKLKIQLMPGRQLGVMEIELERGEWPMQTAWVERNMLGRWAWLVDSGWEVGVAGVCSGFQVRACSDWCNTCLWIVTSAWRILKSSGVGLFYLRGGRCMPWGEWIGWGRESSQEKPSANLLLWPPTNLSLGALPGSPRSEGCVSGPSDLEKRNQVCSVAENIN